MKKLPKSYDLEIDHFLKSEKEQKDFKLDENILARQIHDHADKTKLSHKVITFTLPLAACLAIVFYGSNFFSYENNNPEISQEMKLIETPEVEIIEDYSDFLILDDLLSASRDIPSLYDANFDNGYELLLALETIPLP
jgi:hypothetical protein